VLGAIAAFSLVLTGSATLFARHVRLSSRPAVIVASSVRPLDEQGRPTRGAPLDEGAQVRLLETKGQLALVESGQSQVFVRRSELQPLSMLEAD
jgi:hypothetical protein